MRFFRNIRSKYFIGLIFLLFSLPVFAVKPANVVVLVDRGEAGQQQTVNLLYNTTWKMLDGEFDVRFTTPRFAKVDEVYQDEDVDLVITLGKQGAETVNQRKVIEKPTIVVDGIYLGKQADKTPNIMGITMNQSETSQVFIERVVVALREKLRQK